jgi:hypothetical protein
MAELSLSYFTERLEELRRDWPLLIADADIGPRLSAEVAETGFDQVMRAVLCAGCTAPGQA